MTAPWRPLERLVDDMVDAQWGEEVEFHPWGGSGIEQGGGPDPEREVIHTIGILVMPGAATTGEGASDGGGEAPAMLATWLSISQHNLKGSKLHEWKQEDRVYFPDRNEWYMVDHPLPSVTGRPNIYLHRVQIGSEPEL